MIRFRFGLRRLPDILPLETTVATKLQCLNCLGIVEYFCDQRHAEKASEPGVGIFFMHWTSYESEAYQIRGCRQIFSSCHAETCKTAGYIVVANTREGGKLIFRACVGDRCRSALLIIEMQSGRFTPILHSVGLELAGGLVLTHTHTHTLRTRITVFIHHNSEKLPINILAWIHKHIHSSIFSTALKKERYIRLSLSCIVK